MNTTTAAPVEVTPTQTAQGPIEMRVSAIRYAARDTNIYEFAPVDGRPLPPYQPGAHIDLHLPNGLIRQYSLIEPEPDRSSYTVSVKRDPASRGGLLAVPLNVTRAGSYSYGLAPARVLTHGEYCFSPRNSNDAYCFGVE